jgi:hypothetical protein
MGFSTFIWGFVVGVLVVLFLNSMSTPFHKFMRWFWIMTTEKIMNEQKKGYLQSQRELKELRK